MFSPSPTSLSLPLLSFAASSPTPYPYHLPRPFRPTPAIVSSPITVLPYQWTPTTVLLYSHEDAFRSDMNEMNVRLFTFEGVV